MSVRDVVEAITKVRKYCNSPIQNSPADNHETSTRYIIIDPILRALGWDLADPTQCIVEFPLESLRTSSYTPRIDYVLLDRRGYPAAAVEAKRISEFSDHLDHVDQMERYLESAELRLTTTAVLTNGEYWDIGHRVYNDKYEVDSSPLGLLWPNVQENAMRLYNALSYNALSKDRL